MAIIIPKRGYLTFAELRHRWQCTDNDLRYLVVNAELKPAIKAAHELMIASWEYSTMEDRCVPSGAKIDPQFDYEVTVRPNYWLYLQEPVQTGAMHCEFRLATRERNPQWPDVPWELEAEWSLFLLPKAISMEDIEKEAFFTMDEVLKYEAAHDQDAPPKPEEAPLTTRERNTLLTIIAALCKEANIDHAKPAKAAGMIQSTAAKMGLSIGESTIEGHLKKIPDALATRMK